MAVKRDVVVKRGERTIYEGELTDTIYMRIYEFVYEHFTTVQVFNKTGELLFDVNPRSEQ